MSLYDRDNPQHLQYLNHWKSLLDDTAPPKDKESKTLRKEDEDDDK